MRTLIPDKTNKTIFSISVLATYISQKIIMIIGGSNHVNITMVLESI